MSHRSGFESYEEIYNSYLAQFSSGPPVFESAVKGMTRFQLELMGLTNRRTQAALELPSRLARCRTPQDFGEEQVRFWRTAGEQYAESTERLIAAWQQALAPMAFGLAPAGESVARNDTGDRPHIRLVRSDDGDEDRSFRSRSRTGPANGARRPR